MVELTEYALVVLVSVLFSGASLAAYEGYGKFQTAAEANASFSELLYLASQSVLNGSSEATMALPNGTISCDSGMFTINSAGYVNSQRLPIECNFSVHFSRGIHDVRFDYGEGALSMQVA